MLAQCKPGAARGRFSQCRAWGRVRVRGAEKESGAGGRKWVLIMIKSLVLALKSPGSYNSEFLPGHSVLGLNGSFHLKEF